MTDLWTTKVKRCVVKKKKSKMGAWRRKSGRGVEEERGGGRARRLEKFGFFFIQVSN